MRRIVPPLLVLLLFTAPLPGCTPSGSTTATDGRTPVRVFLLLISTKQVAYFKWAEETYEAAHPDVDIIFEQFPGTSLKDYEIKIRLRYASGQPPDIWYFRENGLSEFANLGLLAPAPDYIERIVQEQSINAIVRDAPYFNGTCYGIALWAAWTALYYNKAMFRESGLDPERPPRTWDDLLTYGERLARRTPDGTLTRAGLSIRKTGYKPGIAEKWLTFFYSAGGTPFNEDGTKSYFDSEAGHAATVFYRDVLERGIDSVELEGDQQGFGQERVAMFIRELHVIDWMRENYPDVEFGVAPLPARDTTYTSYSSGGASPYVVSSDSPHQEAAWRFIEFLASEEAYAQLIRMTGELPLLRSVAGLPEFQDNPYYAVFHDQAVYVPPKFAHDKRSLEILGAYLERFSYGRLSVDEMLERATHDIDTHLRLGYARRGL